jgi:hypothetical protein
VCKNGLFWIGVTLFTLIIKFYQESVDPSRITLYSS